MNKERAREILKDFSQQLNDRKVILPTNSEIYKDNEDLLQALDIAIDSIEHEEKCNKAINDSAKAIAKMQRLCKKCHTNNEWVDVRDRLPSDDKFYLVTANNELYIASYDNKTNNWWSETYDFSSLDVIAWKKIEPYERKE